MVTVMKDGAEVKISKRAGSYVTVRDLIEWSGNGNIEAGRDAVRFFLISRKADTEFVFDVDVALARSDENPVYYVQYAHARICSVLDKVGEEIVGAVLNDTKTLNTSLLTAPREASLLSKLAEYPESLERALDELGPHQVAFYLRELAGEMHSYYNAERVLVEDVALKQARVALMLATRQVLQNGLKLIGVSAPVKM
jgi:arginyl-tRNA synthetase